MLFTMGAIATIPYGMPITMEYAAPLSAIGIVAVFFARIDPLHRWSTVTIWPPLVVLASYGVSIWCSDYSQLAFERSVSMPLFAMVCITVQIVGWHRRALRGVLWSAAIAVVVMAADVLAHRVTGTPLFSSVGKAYGERLSGSQGNPNDLAAASILMPLGLAVLPRTRYMLWHILFVCIGAVPWILSVSRQTLIGWVIAILVMTKSKYSFRTSLIVGGLLTLLLIAVMVAIPVVRERALLTWNTGLGIREAVFAFGCSLAWENPFVGIGPGVFGEYYVPAAMEGWSWRGTPLRQYGMPWVHNLPLEVCIELGGIGAVAFGSVVVGSVRQLRRGIRENTSNAYIATAVLAALAATLVMGLVDLSLIKDWVRCLFWLVVGMSYGVGRPDRP